MTLLPFPIVLLQYFCNYEVIRIDKREEIVTSDRLVEEFYLFIYFVCIIIKKIVYICTF